MRGSESAYLEMLEATFRRPKMLCPEALNLRELLLFARGIARGLYGTGASYTGGEPLRAHLRAILPA